MLNVHAEIGFRMQYACRSVARGHPLMPYGVHIVDFVLLVDFVLW